MPEFDHDTICQCGRKDILLEPDSLAAKVFAEQPSPYVMSSYYHQEDLKDDKDNGARKNKNKRKAKDQAGLKGGDKFEAKSKVQAGDDTRDQAKGMAKDGAADDAEDQPIDTSAYERMDKILIE